MRKDLDALEWSSSSPHVLVSCSPHQTPSYTPAVRAKQTSFPERLCQAPQLTSPSPPQPHHIPACKVHPTCSQSHAHSSHAGPISPSHPFKCIFNAFYTLEK